MEKCAVCLHRLGLNSAAEHWQARGTGNYRMVQQQGTQFWIARAQSMDSEVGLS